MTTSEAIVLDLDGQSVEVATGYRGVGVFLTVLGKRGNRVVTLALPRSKADELSRLLRLAAAASRYNDAVLDSRAVAVEPSTTYLPCCSDLLCYRNNGHEGEHLHPTERKLVPA